MAAALSGLLVFSSACAYRENRSLTAREAIAKRGGAARFHLRNGDLAAFDSWAVEGEHVRGQGKYFDVDRVQRQSGALDVVLADVVIVETSERENLGTGAVVAVSIISVAGTVACLTNPKACFGSCPTFYVPHQGSEDGWALQAEGFSQSIARSLEADDLDDLPAARAQDGFVTLAMRNEALETHLVRKLQLVVVDGPAGSEIAQLQGGTFVALGAAHAAERCDAGAEVAAQLAARDADEYMAGSDGVDLAARTALTLRFAPPHARDLAVSLTARNSLMTTFVLYHLFGMFGREVGTFMTALEQYSPRVLAAFARWGVTLAGVRVSARQGAGAWRPVGRIPYIGPIAAQTRALAFAVDDPDAPVELRLEYERADWRLDAVRVAPVVAKDLRVTRVAAQVTSATRDGQRVAEADAQAQLAGAGERLMTLPGDEVRMRFAVPPARGAQAYFLASRGYYYEWMREAWLKDENVPLAWAYLTHPGRALRELAPAYHAVEPEMDRIFEASKFRRPLAGGGGR